jgi:hypothetical protein
MISSDEKLYPRKKWVYVMCLWHTYAVVNIIIIIIDWSKDRLMAHSIDFVVFQHYLSDNFTSSISENTFNKRIILPQKRIYFISQKPFGLGLMIKTRKTLKKTLIGNVSATFLKHSITLNEYFNVIQFDIFPFSTNVSFLCF